MTHTKEYQGSVVGQNTCTYSRLGNVSKGKASNGGVAEKKGHYLVPKYCPQGAGANYPPKYNTLTHGQDYNCGGYFNIKGAYPHADCGSCKVDYVKRPCNGQISCNAKEFYHRR